MTIYSKEISLIDTNVLVYAADKTSEFHLSAKNIRDLGISGKENLCICPQILEEFFAVITDSRRVKNPRDPKEVIEELEKYIKSQNIVKIYPKEDTLVRTINFLKKYNIKKQEIFDARLVATMLSNSVSRIYTFNKEDFIKYKEIKVITPPL